MKTSDASALHKSDLNPFLFAEVGTELNGSDLTTLSLLARLGSDPWAEAGRLAALPSAAATDWLNERIARTPLSRPALGESRATALRLALLLPPRPRASVDAPSGARAMSHLALITMIWCALAIGYLASSSYAPATAPARDAGHDR